MDGCTADWREDSSIYYGSSFRRSFSLMKGKTAKSLLLYRHGFNYQRMVRFFLFSRPERLSVGWLVGITDRQIYLFIHQAMGIQTFVVVLVYYRYSSLRIYWTWTNQTFSKLQLWQEWATTTTTTSSSSSSSSSSICSFTWEIRNAHTLRKE